MKLPPTTRANAEESGATACADSMHAARRQVRSDELFGGSRQVLIEHFGEVYSLRQTSKGKLILTK